MKVLVYPGWENENYYKLLYNSIEGVEYAGYSGAIFPLLRNYMRSKPNVIHVHWVADYFALNKKGYFGFLLRYVIAILDLLLVKAVLNVKLVWTVHNLYEHHTQHQKAERQAKKLLGYVADSVIVHGKSAIPLIVNEFHIDTRKIQVIKHGTFRPLYPVISLSKAECREKLQLPPNDTLYLFPGTDHDYKGLLELLKELHQWSHPGITFIVAGKTRPIVMQEAERLKNNVIIHNHFISEEDFPMYFNAADWVIIPYKRILTSATLITAMGFGKPLIVPDMGTLADYTNNNGAVLYNATEKSGVINAIEQSTTKNAKEMGEYNLAVDKSLSWLPIQNQLIHVYKTI